jgi:putative copper resistance protein D
MAQLLDLFGFLSVLLRAMTLVAQTLAVGGVVFALVVARPLRLAEDNSGQAALSSLRPLVVWSALGLAVVQIILISVNSAALMATAELSLGEVVGANFFRAGEVMIAASLGLALIAHFQLRRVWHWALALAVVIIGASVMTSHAASRLTDRAPLAIATGLHQAAAAVWIGGLPCLLLALSRCSDEDVRRTLTRRFSRLALACVSVLAAAGLTLSFFYIDAVDAVYGTAYGVMVSAKVLLFGTLLLLGALNFFTVRRLGVVPTSRLNRLRRLAEVEVGVGFTVILAAASLTSVPPAADLTVDRVSLTEIGVRMAPRRPRLRSPGLEELQAPTRQTPQKGAAGAPIPQSFVPGQTATYVNTPADIAWSEYNHHWAGLMVLVAGLLQLTWSAGRAKWARHWPLVFLALAAFIFVRADPENWPLGPNGFWASFGDPEVLQHRAYAALTVALGLFEWAVRTGRIHSERAALVFPLICALGGALLLTHSHSLGNVKEELLAELTHVPLALLGVTAGWARWLELRLPPADRRIPSFVRPVCFVLVGILLLLYREG